MKARPIFITFSYIHTLTLKHSLHCINYGSELIIQKIKEKPQKNSWKAVITE